MTIQWKQPDVDNSNIFQSIYYYYITIKQQVYIQKCECRTPTCTSFSQLYCKKLFAAALSHAHKHRQRNKGSTRYNEAPSCLIEVIDAVLETCNIQCFIKTKCKNQDNGTGGLHKSGSLEIGADISHSSHLIPKTDNLRQTINSRLFLLSSFN